MRRAVSTSGDLVISLTGIPNKEGATGRSMMSHTLLTVYLMNKVSWKRSPRCFYCKLLLQKMFYGEHNYSSKKTGGRALSSGNHL
jgi:PP-loop superfamily ATP-utilizing enzyme